MSALASTSMAAPDEIEEAVFANLLKSIRRNRFLPIPPQVGSGVQGVAGVCSRGQHRRRLDDALAEAQDEHQR